MTDDAGPHDVFDNGAETHDDAADPAGVADPALLGHDDHDGKAAEAPTDDGSEPAPEPVPSPAHSPEDVFELLRESIEAAPSAADAAAARGEHRRRALQGEVGPFRVAFAFASPQLRAEHGDVVAFARAMGDPITGPLFRAGVLERGPLSFEGDEAEEADAATAVLTVLARLPPSDDAPEPRTFDLTFRRVTAGKYAGCWMLDDVDLVYNGVSPRFRRMPTVNFAGETVRCEDGDTLRDVLLEAEGRTPHNDAAQIANCGGNGLCGTCAVEVDGETDEQERREARRLSLPPFDGEDGLRLSCQTCVRGDLEVRKHDGLWGQHTEEFVDDQAGAAGSDVDGGSPAESVTVTAEEYAGNFEYDPGALDSSAGQSDPDPDSNTDSAPDSNTDPHADSGTDTDHDSVAGSGGEQT